ncbi:helix-turn-helix transcriptional regulator [Gordonibacter sp.]|uniref:helix-turn-helix domain-containing protein n=1 Tax=Gordonibacter sp. TaxID=1968902 RepID=UPI0034275906
MGIEQRPFSRMSGVGNSHLRRIEAGEASPSLTTIAKIASAFAVEPADLLDETYRLMEQERRSSRA